MLTDSEIKTCKKELFFHPFTCTISGPSGCGKTQLLMSILDQRDELISLPPERIIYCYATWQEKFSEYESFIEFKKGIYEDMENLNKDTRNLIIFDDLMTECQNDLSIQNLFTRGSHHLNISVFMLTQNIFNKGKFSRTINLNSHYTILFNNPRDKTQIRYLAREMYPDCSKFLVESYNDATKRAHGYLFLDNKQSTEDVFRVQTNIVDEFRIVYVLKNFK